jgi:N-acetylmuramoyl-L-alanine amidase
MAAAVWLTATGAAIASEPMTALARPDPAESSIVDFGANVHVTLTLSQPVLWRLYTLEAPRRLVIEFGEVDWAGTQVEAFRDSDAIAAVRAERGEPGWSRLVLDLAEPLAVETAGMSTVFDDGRAVLKLQLAPTSEKAFAAAAIAAPHAAPLPGLGPVPEAGRPEGPPVVVLDPGHGGIDPGALAGTVNEADLMLTFARELEAALTARGFTVVLTRDTDIFVPLETRLSIAREAGASLFMSLHADALAEGRASGATVYTLSHAAADAAAEKLAERHERHDLVSGIDLHGHDDGVAQVLMALARTETQPRSDRLADAIVEGLGEATGDLHKRPRLTAGFSVLKAPDIPSVLIELGFLSNAQDREKLQTPAWRQRAAEGIANAVVDWAGSDVRRRRLLRQ